MRHAVWRLMVDTTLNMHVRIVYKKTGLVRFVFVAFKNERFFQQHSKFL